MIFLQNLLKMKNLKEFILKYLTKWGMSQFDDAFKGVCSLCDMEMAVKPLTDDEIKKNMKDLKKKLAVFFTRLL